MRGKDSYGENAAARCPLFGKYKDNIEEYKENIQNMREKIAAQRMLDARYLGNIKTILRHLEETEETHDSYTDNAAGRCLLLSRILGKC